MQGYPILRHSPTAFCPSALSLNPTWAITNLSLRFELCHLPPSSAPRPSSSSLSPALVGQRRSPSAAQPRAVPSRIQSGFQELGLGRAAVGDSWCLGWHPLVLMCSGPDPPVS